MGKKYHKYNKKKYVYQSSDGQLIFVHPHNYNMLKHDINYNFNAFPSILRDCKILQIEQYVQSYDLRRRYPFLAFIPVDIAFSFIEVDLSSIVSKATSKYFERQSLDRKSLRMEKEKEIERELKQKQILEEQRVALQKQKYAKPQIDINDYSEFPSLSVPSKSVSDSNGEHVESHSDPNENKSDSHSPKIQAKNIKSPRNKSWSEITIKNKSECSRNKALDSPTFDQQKNNKKKRRHRGGRNRKRNKNKNKDKDKE